MAESEKIQWDANLIANYYLVNFEETFNKHVKIGKNYLIDDVNRETIKTVCQYFANDPEFEKIKEGYSLNKGLLILGPAGTGKTHLLKNLQKNPRFIYELINCSEVVTDFSCKGRGVLGKYSDRHDAFRYTGYAFDDLGAEDIGANFSDKCETMLELLLSYYNNLNGNFFHIHITSNLTVSQIRERYGDRLASRIKEMFNVIKLIGDDRRK